jgi:hypothetical protein
MVKVYPICTTTTVSYHIVSIVQIQGGRDRESPSKVIRGVFSVFS